MPRTRHFGRLTGLMLLSGAVLAGTAATAAPKRAKGPDWAVARTAFASAPPLDLDEGVFFACSATWGLWNEAVEGGKVKVPAGALPPQLLEPKAGETAADWGLYMIDSDEAFALHQATEKRLAPELKRVLAGDITAVRSWFARLGTCKVPG